MYALSVKQPFAEAIASGEKRYEYRTWAPRTIEGRDLLIVASKTPGPGYAGEPTGVAICVVRVVRIGGAPQGYAWHLESPRRVEPEPIKGSAALFTVADDRIRYVAARGDVETKRAARATERAKEGPYTFEIDDRKVRGESRATPAAARKRAAELANEKGRAVWICRDGHAIACEEPEDDDDENETGAT